MEEDKLLHFTLGENIGIRLHEISTEHLYDFNLKKALDVWRLSLRCDDEIAVKLTLGELVCDKSEGDDCTMVVSDKAEISSERLGDYKNCFPNIDFIISKIENLADEDLIDSLYKSLSLLDFNNYEAEIELDGSYFSEILCGGLPIKAGTITLNSRDIVKYVLENNIIDVDLDEITDGKLRNILYSVNTSMSLINKYSSIKEVIEFIDTRFNTTELRHLKYKLDSRIDRIKDIIKDIRLVCFGNSNCIDRKDIVSEYIESENKIKKQLEDFGPVDILDKYNAGWLSREGDFFGLNGISSSWLHITLANKIVDFYKLEIPVDWKYSIEAYLESLGFAKITGSWILYSAYNYPEKLGMTSAQMKILKEYGEKCYRGILHIGWEKKPVSCKDFLDYDPEILFDDFEKA